MPTDSINSDIVQGSDSESETAYSGAFFPIGKMKLAVMSVFTFGLYEFY